MYHLDDNIAAIASARGASARGVVRASGPTIIEKLVPLFHSQSESPLDSLRRPTRLLAELKLDGIAAPLPGALLIWPTRRSYTGEPLVEWHTIGSPPLLEASLRTICGAGARLAEPGEFTLRAFLAGRIDLTQAEAVLGVIEAQDQSELNRALSQLAGGLAQPLGQVRSDLLDLLIDLEAGLDFVEEDLHFVERTEVRRRLAEALAAVTRINEQMTSRGNASEWPRVVLRGAPNVGKSSLFNVLAGDRAAIVTPQAGTTRDYLEAALWCGEVRCQLVDTAGAEEDADRPIERAAQRATNRQIQEADVELLCLDATRAANSWEREELARPLDGKRLVVFTKADAAVRPIEHSPVAYDRGPSHVVTSSRTGRGLDELRLRIAAKLVGAASPGSVVATTALRSRGAVDQARSALQAALEACEQGDGEELIAAEIRAALDGLGTVVGAVHTDELLDGIFSRFCIGK